MRVPGSLIVPDGKQHFQNQSYQATNNTSLSLCFFSSTCLLASTVVPSPGWNSLWLCLHIPFFFFNMHMTIVKSQKVSVQFSPSVMSDSWPHESQHTGPLFPSPTPGVYSNSCLSSRWCHLAISSSVIPFSSCPQSLPASGFFSNESTLCMRWPEYWSFSFSISPSNEHPGQIFFRMDWLDLLAVQGTLKSLLQHHRKFNEW